MYKKLDKFLWRTTVLGLLTALVIYLIGADINPEKQNHFLFSIIAQMLVLIPLVTLIMKEKKANGKKQKILSGLSNALFYATIFYWLVRKFDILNDYFVIALFLCIFVVSLFFETGTKFISGFLYTYFAMMMFSFFMIDDSFHEKMYLSVSLKTVDMNLSLFWWLMVLVGYVLANPPLVKMNRSPKLKRKKKMETKQQKPSKPSLKDLHKPVFRKGKKRLRDYINK